MNRRALIQALGFVSVAGCRDDKSSRVQSASYTQPMPLGLAMSSDAESLASPEKTTSEFDIRNYDFALLPREHGQLTHLQQRIFRRYPSRDHCMQMAAFFGAAGGLLIHTKDPQGSISDWEILPGECLRIHSYGAPPSIEVVAIDPTVEAAAAVYREWALSQPWVQQRQRHQPKMNLISVASNPDTRGQRRHLLQLSQLLSPPWGAWFTQWRRFRFDAMYPDYVPSDPVGFAELIADLRREGCTAFPYINGMLWDDRLSAFSDLGKTVGIRDAESRLVSYNADMPYLRHACPYSSAWQRQITEAREGVRDSNGEMSEGIYLDMLLAAAPYQCWSTEHGHVPGDPTAWQRGVRSLLQSMPGTVMVEGNAEIYLDLVDSVLMHLYTKEADAVPLWQMVYGDIVTSVGWSLPKAFTDGELELAISKSRVFGVSGLGTPWMTSVPEPSILHLPGTAEFLRNAVSS